MMYCTKLYAQQVIPSGIYGAAYSGTVGNLSVNWVIGTLTPTDMSVLPVRLISFKGHLRSNGNAELEWKTAEESSNKGFEIQKSIDGKHFEQIGWVDGAGDYQGEKSYHFTDNNLQTTSYYRLKQVDYDGEFTISRIVSVIPENESLDRFSAFPNPSHDGVINLTLPDHAISLTLSDKRGSVIQKQENPAASQKLKLPEAGFYLLRIQTAVGERTLKLMRD